MLLTFFLASLEMRLELFDSCLSVSATTSSLAFAKILTELGSCSVELGRFS